MLLTVRETDRQAEKQANATKNITSFCRGGNEIFIFTSGIILNWSTPLIL